MSIENAIKKLRNFYAAERRLPTYKEMAALFGLSSSSSSFYITKKLIREGILGKDEKGNIYPEGLFQIPTLGLIHAGIPAPADMLQDESIDLYSYLLKLPGAMYSLIVKGDSMIDEGIFDGDLVLVQKGREPHNRDIVAAFVDGDWTLKQYLRQGNEIILMPANPNYKPIRPRHSLQLGGVVISVIRNYH